MVKEVKDWPIQIDKTVELRTECLFGGVEENIRDLSFCFGSPSYLESVEKVIKEANLKNGRAEIELYVAVIDQYGPTPKISNIISGLTLSLYPSISEAYLTVRIEVKKRDKLLGIVSKTEKILIVQEAFLILLYPFYGDYVANDFPKIFANLTKAVITEIKEKRILEIK
ncbi:hypothetical protein [Leptospira licerasiae]|uniref:hypothetical protein n=1 Tax=Leptospira licerasiae TaxID=447106 RepID=UPI0010837FB8|nr:hypothetical protein [Leptospira licerasiae]TGM89380.1 hypothetical protein EHR05_10905 [Leptospira licerasiae]